MIGSNKHTNLHHLRSTIRHEPACGYSALPPPHPISLSLKEVSLFFSFLTKHCCGSQAADPLCPFPELRHAAVRMLKKRLFNIELNWDAGDATHPLASIFKAHISRRLWTTAVQNVHPVFVFSFMLRIIIFADEMKEIPVICYDTFLSSFIYVWYGYHSSMRTVANMFAEGHSLTKVFVGKC